jgi:MerR family transcriptional regulator, copper efflux regulator
MARDGTGKGGDEVTDAFGILEGVCAVRIGKAAKESGIPAKMIRYYEKIGLIPAARRLKSGYREYSEPDMRLLRLIQRARDAGLSPERAGDVARFLQHIGRAEDVGRAMALVAELEARATAAGELAKVLRHHMQARVDMARGRRSGRSR